MVVGGVHPRTNSQSLEGHLKQKLAQSPDYNDFNLEVTDDHNSFVASLSNAKKSHPKGACVDSKTVEDLEGAITILNSDGTAGGAVKPDGDIVAVFKNPSNKTRNAGLDIVLNCIANGGKKLDCYGTALANTYAKTGMEAVARVKYVFGYNDEMDCRF